MNAFKTLSTLIAITLCSLNHNAVATTQPDGDDVYVIVENMPIFPGGEEALRNYVTNNIQYPEEAHKQGIQGRVFVCFIIGTNGAVQNVKVARSVHPLLDAEAVRVVKSMPKWTPGQHRGKTVKVSYTIPINFSLK
mgnify:FL=1